MNQKRSLSQSLPTAELPPEAWAVIREGSPQRIETPPKALELAKLPDPESAPARGTSPSLDEESEASKARRLVALCIRVRSDLADRLIKVAFERKLQRKAPFSQQDIATQALTQWLRRGGYLD